MRRTDDETGPVNFLPDSDRICLVTKPLNPPWNDSGKILPRNLVENSERYRYRTFVVRGYAGQLPNASAEPVYIDSGRFSPSLGNQIRLIRALFRKNPPSSLYHFFFTPNRKSSMTGRMIMAFKNRSHSMQTVTSEPTDERHLRSLLFTDTVVTVSEHTRHKIEKLTGRDVKAIHPGIRIPGKEDETYQSECRDEFGTRDRFAILYPGDLTYSGSTRLLMEIIKWLDGNHPRIAFIIASRIKTDADTAAETAIKKAVSGLNSRVNFIGEVTDMNRLLRAVDLVVFPVLSLYGKMDLPLVLLESMAAGIPVVLSDLPPLRELVTDQAGLIFPPGDIEACIRILSELIEKVELRRTIGLNAALSARRRFGAERMARQYEILYDRILERTR